MNHRELRAMYRHLKKHAADCEELMDRMIEREEAVNYSI